MAGTALGTTIFASEVEAVASGGVASGTTILPGGVLEVISGGTVAGTLLFSGSGGDLLIEVGTSLNILGGLAVSGFVAGDTIDLAGIAFDSNGSVNLQSGNVLTIIENGGTYDLQLDPSQSFANEFFHLSNDGLSPGGAAITQDSTPCYCRGTLI